jgi:hypothetical protein
VDIFTDYDTLFPLTIADVGKKIGIAIRAVNTDNYAAGQFFFVPEIISGGLVNVFEPEYQAVIDRAILEGFTLPSSAVQQIQNALVKDLKDNSLWTGYSALWVFAADAGSDFYRINWCQPSSTLATYVNALTFTDNVGVISNDAISYVNTNHNPIINGLGVYTQNNANCIIGTKDSVQYSIVGAANNAANSLVLTYDSSSGLVNSRINSNSIQNTTTLSDKLAGFNTIQNNRSSNVSVNATVNSNDRGTAAISSQLLTTVPLYITKRNRNTLAPDGAFPNCISFCALGQSRLVTDQQLQSSLFLTYLNDLP